MDPNTIAIIRDKDAALMSAANAFNQYAKDHLADAITALEVGDYTKASIKTEKALANIIQATRASANVGTIKV